MCSVPEWVARFAEDLWLKPDDAGEADARVVSALLSLRAGDRVLDAPCGAGRVALPLARAGCRMTGVDRCERFIGRGRANFAAAQLAGEFIAMDLRDVEIHGAFDAAYNWSGSFGYFDDAVNLEILRRLAMALRPGGRLAVDQPNREALLRHFRPETKAGTLATRCRWDPAAQRVDAEWIRGEERILSSIRLYTVAQFRDLFACAGLEWIGAVDSTDGTPYRRGSRRVAVVGRRP